MLFLKLMLFVAVSRCTNCTRQNESCNPPEIVKTYKTEGGGGTDCIIESVHEKKWKMQPSLCGMLLLWKITSCYRFL